MFLMYDDESGDSGIFNSPTRYFILSAIIIHESVWRVFLENLITFRRTLKTEKNLKMNDEIHAKDFINSPGELVRIKRNERVDILKKCIHFLSGQEYINTFSIVVDKTNKSEDVFELTWETMINRFENTLKNKNFPSPFRHEEKGLILSDNTDGEKLIKLLRRMRRFNPVPNRADLYDGGFRDLKVEYIIEDPVFRDSARSYIHQMTDVVAYFCRQKFEPNAYLKKKGAVNYYDNLGNVLNTKVSRSGDGIVRR